MIIYLDRSEVPDLEDIQGQVLQHLISASEKANGRYDKLHQYYLGRHDNTKRPPEHGEYLSSSPKYNLLYEAFGWDIPTYVHCASVMITDPETKTVRKMSKRHGDPSYEDLIREG